MLNKHILLPYILLILISLALMSCSSSKTTSPAPAPTTEQRDAALERYLKGQTLDQQGNYAAAILEYQDALRYFEDPSIYFALSKDYIILDKNEQAVESAAKAVQLEPANISFRQNLGEIYAQSHRIDDAMNEFQEIIKRDSSQLNAWFNYAELLQIKAPTKSLEVSRHILDRFGPNEAVYIQIIRLCEILDKKQDAAIAMKGLLVLDPTDPDLKKSLGDLYMDIDSVDAALALYNELVELYPENVIIRAALAHAYLTKRDYRNAQAQFDTVMRRDTLSIDDQLEFGKVFTTFIQNDSAVIPIALELFQGMAAQYPDDWRPYWFLGAIANIAHNDSTAIDNFTKVTEIAKWNPDGWVGVASIWFDKGELEKAVQLLEKARVNVKEDFRVEFIYGLTLERLKRPTDAALALERAVLLNPKSVDAYSALGLVYDELKRPWDSDTIYERALRLNPKHDMVLNNYGYSLTERGIQLDRAAAMIQQALEAQPDNTSYLDSMGWVEFKLGNYERAEQYISKAVQKGNPGAVVLEHLGDVYSKLNQSEKALQYWKQALEIDPTNQTLKAKIERGTL